MIVYLEDHDLEEVTQAIMAAPREQLGSHMGLVIDQLTEEAECAPLAGFIQQYPHLEMLVFGGGEFPTRPSGPAWSLILAAVRNNSLPAITLQGLCLSVEDLTDSMATAIAERTALVKFNLVKLAISNEPSGQLRSPAAGPIVGAAFAGSTRLSQLSLLGMKEEFTCDVVKELKFRNSTLAALGIKLETELVAKTVEQMIAARTVPLDLLYIEETVLAEDRMKCIERAIQTGKLRSITFRHCSYPTSGRKAVSLNFFRSLSEQFTLEDVRIVDFEGRDMNFVHQWYEHRKQYLIDHLSNGRATTPKILPWVIEKALKGSPEHGPCMVWMILYKNPSLFPEATTTIPDRSSFFGSILRAIQRFLQYFWVESLDE